MANLVLSLLTRAGAALACPSCPTQNAAREVFLNDDPWLRLGGLLGPFAVTAGLIALFIGKLQRRGRGWGGGPHETQ